MMGYTAYPRSADMENEMTELEREVAHNEWLELYTWVQNDGTCDFHNPRPRPSGLQIDPREAFGAA